MASLSIAGRRSFTVNTSMAITDSMGPSGLPNASFAFACPSFMAASIDSLVSISKWVSV